MFREMLRPAVHGLRSVLGTHGVGARLAALEARTAPAAPSSAAAAGEPPPGLDINVLLHQSRGAYLRAMPPGARRLLSAGCSGNWYFDWITQTYGPVEEHLGIEFYTPEPAGLPANVRWIANTASDMAGVAEASCDLIFSGQNAEHLWPEEVAGFLLEAARVTRTGGHVVMDSPNRDITRPLVWSHPEHTIELTADEISELLVLAGFDVTARRGIWLCRDPRSGRMLPFDPNVADADWSVTERLLAAHDNLADAFIWWVEAVRTDRVPDAAAVHARMAALFAEHWPERVQRLLVPAGRALEGRADGEWVVMAAGEGGPAFFGPYMPLKAGRYACTWEMEGGTGGGPVARFDIQARDHDEPLAQHDATGGEREVRLEITLTDTTFGLQFRALSLGRAGFAVRRRIRLEQIG